MANGQNKNKKDAVATWLNADKTLFKVEHIEHADKIFQKMKLYGTPVDKFETAMKNKSFIVQVKEGTNPDIRNINSEIYFAEMDSTREETSRFALKKAIAKQDKPKEIEDKELRYGINFFISREHVNLDKEKISFVKQFETYISHNSTNESGINVFEKLIESQTRGIEKAFALLKSNDLAKTNEKGNLQLDNMNKFKKVELIGLVNSDYAEISDFNIKKVVENANEKKAENDSLRKQLEQKQEVEKPQTKSARTKTQK